MSTFKDFGLTMTLSIIASYYNQKCLDLWLYSLSIQSNTNFEICLVNDGGSEYDITNILKLYDKKLDIKYKYLGPSSTKFRLAKAKNAAIELSTKDRLLITDVDCLFIKNSVETHSGKSDIVAGFRHHIPACFVDSLTRKSVDNLHKISIPSDNRFNILPTMLNKEWKASLVWGCHFSVDKMWYDAAGGFDSSFVGWGYEDLDLVNRMVKFGCSIVFTIDTYLCHVDHGCVLNKTKNRQKYLRKFDDLTDYSIIT